MSISCNLYSLLACSLHKYHWKVFVHYSFQYLLFNFYFDCFAKYIVSGYLHFETQRRSRLVLIYEVLFGVFCIVLFYVRTITFEAMLYTCSANVTHHEQSQLINDIYRNSH